MKKRVLLMLDSGVFSAWARKETLDLPTYIQYLKDHRELLHSYVVMDKIPGVFGRPRTQREVEDSAKVSYDNLQVMKGEGLKPIPIFHQGESFKWLERLLQDGEDYLGISSAKDLWAQDQARWLDQVFSILTDSSGRPLVRTHGFGITNPRMLLRYPWATVDSTTWSLTPGYGQIVVPVYRNGKPDYSQVPKQIVVSGVQHESPSSQKRQFEALGPLTQQAVLNFLQNEVGVGIAEARYGTNVRRKAVLVYYLHLMEHLKDVRFQHSHNGMLHGIHVDLPSDLKPITVKQFQIMFATMIHNKEWSQLMNEVGANTRLLSYYETRKWSSKDLETYVRTGMVGPYTKKPPKPNWSETHRNYRRLALLGRLQSPEQE